MLCQVAKPQHGHWQLSVRNIRVGVWSSESSGSLRERLVIWQLDAAGTKNETLELCETGDCTAIADTGTSLIGVPKARRGPVDIS